MYLQLYVMKLRLISYQTLYIFCLVFFDHKDLKHVVGRAVESRNNKTTPSNVLLERPPSSNDSTRNCETYRGGFCDEYIRSSTIYNNSLVARNLSTPFEKSEKVLQQLFYLLEGKECHAIARWFACASMFPPCENNVSAQVLPCQEVCTLMENTICQSQWHSIIKLQEILFNHVVIPSCHIFPTYDGGTASCLYPKFIRDLVPNKEETNERLSSLNVIIISSTSAGIALLLAVVLLIICLRRSRQKQTAKSLFMDEITDVHRAANQIDRYATLDTIGQSYTNLEMLVDALGIEKFTKNGLEVGKKLGEGAFGKVVQCKTQLESGETKMVAVKYLKANANTEMEQYFCKEVEILSNFNHPNVIPLLGVCLQAPTCLVLEFMKHGDLNEYIRLRSGSYHAIAGSYGNLPDGIEFSSPELSFHNLLLITSQIADGLDYLAMKRFVHRDIATRNILVGDDLRIKISDFGLAHDIYGSDYYMVDTQKMLPLRWLSPEALSLGKFTIHSDMWAFGVLMWEIFTYGMQPFYGCTNDEVCHRIRCLKVPPRPYCCPNKVYELMRGCWKFEPTQRNSAGYIKTVIKTWLDERELFIEAAWKRLLLPPLADRIPTIKKAKMKYLNIRSEITL